MRDGGGWGGWGVQDARSPRGERLRVEARLTSQICEASLRSARQRLRVESLAIYLSFRDLRSTFDDVKAAMTKSKKTDAAYHECVGAFLNSMRSRDS
eukprot:6975798-Alexandrium_andersonii.AAC.1